MSLVVSTRYALHFKCDFCPAEATRIAAEYHDAYFPFYMEGWRDRKKVRCPSCEQKRKSKLLEGKLARQATAPKAPWLRCLNRGLHAEVARQGQKEDA